jgi:hypothetical protein
MSDGLQQKREANGLESARVEERGFEDGLKEDGALRPNVV